MYPNLKAEMARNGVTVKDIQKVIGKNEKTARNKMNGKTPITISEAFSIALNLFPGLTVDYLFSVNAA